MKKISLSVIALIFLSINIAQAQTESFLKVSIGANFLTASGGNENFKTLGPSSNNRFPAIRIEDMFITIFCTLNSE